MYPFIQGVNTTVLKNHYNKPPFGFATFAEFLEKLYFASFVFKLFRFIIIIICFFENLLFFILIEFIFLIFFLFLFFFFKFFHK